VIKPFLVLSGARARPRREPGGAQDVTVPATLETEPFFDNDEDDADADDPAIWVHPENRARSVVLGTLKNGGLAVFDLAGRTIQPRVRQAEGALRVERN
jgi:myo-inositol-hexaphosphate 3-phosphohydrolase